MVLLDTNVFIYISNSTLDAKVISGHDIAYSSATKIEALGYHELPVQEQARLKIIFAKANHLRVSDSIIDEAISLKQYKKMSLGDAIVASTALENNLELWTANEKDFADIDSLKIHNPLKSIQ